MKLFYSPGACSVGIHVVLEELGHPYQTHRVKFAENEQHSAGFLARNPKAKIPVLERDDGSLLTEYGAISHYLTAGTPLAVSGTEAEARAIEALDYIVGTIHMQGFARVFRSSNFTPNAADEAWVKGRGRDIVAKGYALIAETLSGRQYLFGAFSHVDAALFYVENWAGRADIALPPTLAHHLDRMKARPAVQAVEAAERAPQ